jgi:hypothetical protein
MGGSVTVVVAGWQCDSGSGQGGSSVTVAVAGWP